MEQKKSTNWAPLIVNIVLLVIGLIMICAPDVALGIIVIVPAIAAIVYGAVSIIYFACKKDRTSLRKSFLVWPIIAVIAGVLILAFNEGFGTYVVPVLIGAWLIISGIKAMVSSGKYSPSPGKRFSLILGLVMLVFGILFVVFGISGGIQSLLVGMGVLLLIYGIISIISLIVRCRLDAANTVSRVK